MGDVNVNALPSPNEKTNQPEFALYVNEHFHARSWVGSAENVTDVGRGYCFGCEL